MQTELKVGDLVWHWWAEMANMVEDVYESPGLVVAHEDPNEDHSRLVVMWSGGRLEAFDKHEVDVLRIDGPAKGWSND
tara:strand:+ start:92 stop:325 length:234 start_codon:yes stop_codon:yes gene_type:complete